MRPGAGTYAVQKRRTHHWCVLFELARLDGTVLRFADTNETVWFLDKEYTPIGNATANAEDREAQKEAELDLSGALIDDRITAADIRAGKYRGAILRRMVVDWALPIGDGRVYKEALYTLTEPQASGVAWRAKARGQSHRMQNRVGRIYETDCDYILGDPHTCKADLSAKQVDNVAVVNVVDPRLEFDADSTQVAGTFGDTYFQEGSVLWRTGNNASTEQVIGDYALTNRRIKLYLPTPRDIEVGDTFFLRPGCDGTPATCKVKFDNFDRFGGDPFTPGTKAIMRKPE